MISIEIFDKNQLSQLAQVAEQNAKNDGNKRLND